MFFKIAFMLIYPFVVRTGLCSCNGMLKSKPEALVFLIQVKVTCPVINTRCSFPVFIKTFFFIYGCDKTFCYPWIDKPISFRYFWLVELKEFVYLSIKYIQKVIKIITNTVFTFIRQIFKTFDKLFGFDSLKS